MDGEEDVGGLGGCADVIEEREEVGGGGKWK